MFEKVKPNTSEFERLKKFCFLIGEGRLEPEEIEIHYFNLYHPTIPEARLIVYWDALAKHFYIREPIEGSMLNLDELPLVHSFPLQKRAVFPYAVDIERDEMVYYYDQEGVEGASMVERVSPDRYERLKFLFDEKNPIPWTEKKHLKDYPLAEWMDTADGCQYCERKSRVIVTSIDEDGNAGDVHIHHQHEDDCLDIEERGTYTDVAGWEFHDRATIELAGRKWPCIKARMNIGPCLNCWKLVVGVPLILFPSDGQFEVDFCFTCAGKLGILEGLK